MRYLIAPDKFKGTLSASEVCQILAQAVRTHDHGAQIDLAPIADGGEGTAELVASQLGAERRSIVTVDALERSISAEFFGGLGLILGLFSRVAALGILLAMLGAIATVHYRYGLFMDWHGTQKGHGFEYHLIVIALALVVIVKGAGAFSIDYFWYQHYTAGTSARQEITRR